MEADPETSEDAILGGRLRIRQPLRGHRVGHDAILLAAATAAHSGELAVDLGAGVGAAGLRLPRASLDSNWLWSRLMLGYVLWRRRTRASTGWTIGRS